MDDQKIKNLIEAAVRRRVMTTNVDTKGVKKTYEIEDFFDGLKGGKKYFDKWPSKYQVFSKPSGKDGVVYVIQKMNNPQEIIDKMVVKFKSECYAFSNSAVVFEFGEGKRTEFNIIREKSKVGAESSWRVSSLVVYVNKDQDLVLQYFD